jgi:hypothetical protein
MVDRHFHRPQAAEREAVEVGGIDMVAADPGEHLGVETPPLGFGKAGEPLPESCLGVPPDEVAVDPGQIVAISHDRRQRPLADMRLAGGHDVAPPLLPLERRQPAGELVSDTGRGNVCGDRQGGRDGLGR